MRTIKEIAQDARSSIYQRWLNWRMLRYQKSMDAIVRPWRVGATGGSTISLGYMPRKKAMQQVADMKLGTIVYVDNEAGFIAVRSKDNEH